MAYENKDMHLSLDRQHPMAGNVACLNGSAHVREAHVEEDVTCERCLRKMTNYYHLQRGRQREAPSWRIL